MKQSIKSLQIRTRVKATEKFEDKKGQRGNYWKHEEPEYHLRRMEEEFYEFRQAVEHYNSPEDALEELADILNFALFYLRTSGR